MANTTNIFATLLNLINEDSIILLMILLALYDVFKLYQKNYKKEEEYISQIPNTIAALGIIGTFVGIYLGLREFDTTPGKMEISIIKLLDGMKTAFMTSIFGLIISTILKLIPRNKNLAMDSTDSGEAILEKFDLLIETIKNSDNSSIQESVAALSETTKNTNQKFIEAITHIKTEMKNLSDGITSSQKEAQERLNQGLTSMSLQLKELVTSNKSISKEIERGNNALIDEFVGFREAMAKAFTEEFTNALTRSIEDLNTQLQEQLGENFKNAVNKLVDWQEHYIETISYTTQVLDKTKNSMSGIEYSMKSISERADSLTAVAEKVEPLISGIDNVQSRLGQGLTKLNTGADLFQENTEKMKDSTDELKLNLANLFDSFAHMTKLIENNMKQNQNNVNELSEKIGDSMQEVINSSKLITATSQAQIENIENVSKQIGAAYDTLVQELAERLRDNYDVADEKMNQAVAKLEESLKNNLDNCLNGLVGALTTVSHKFVTDYEPLTERLKEVVHLAKKIGA